MPLVIWKSNRSRQRQRKQGTDALKRRSRGPERLEPRQLLAASPIHVGVVYLETDYLESDQDVGSDSQGDRFILSFTGGAPNTELNELRIRTDKDGDGISVGDPIYDTAQGGRGKNGAHGFQIVRVHTTDGRAVDATAEVEDGGQELILRLSSFRAGDRLEFTIDVDEVLRNAIAHTVRQGGRPTLDPNNPADRSMAEMSSRSLRRIVRKAILDRWPDGVSSS